MSRSVTGMVSAVALATAVTIAPPTPTAATAQTQATAGRAAPAADSGTVEVERLAGSDRYATAAAIAQRWTGPVQRVYVVGGSRFQEAVVAAARAGATDAPVLLTRSDLVPVSTVDALKSLRPQEIVVVGKPSSVSDDVLDTLRAHASSGNVQRLAGADRYGTSGRVAATYPAGQERVFIASGEQFPDALTAAALAGAEGGPLLLSRRDALPSGVARQLARLAPREVVVVGGPGAIDESVALEAASYSTTGHPQRLAGRDRYETAAAVAKELGAPTGASFVASGQKFPDALVVSALGARDQAPVVLTRRDKIPAATTTALTQLSPGRIGVAGGPGAVSDAVVEALGEGTTAPEPPPAPERPTGFPSSDNTGVPDDVQLTRSGSLTITEDNTVIDGLYVTGEVSIYADHVTIRNSLIESGTSGNPVYVDRRTTGTLIENVEIDNRGGGGIGIFMRGSGTVRQADVHSAEDGIRINSDDVTVEYSYIHDLIREDGGHHDTIQIRRGDDVTIRGNNLQAYVRSTDDPMNAAIQIGSLSGDDQISDLLVLGNLMNGGNYTINGGGRNEVDSARYAENEFGRDFRFGVQSNLQNSVWEDTNVWHDTGLPAG